MFKVKEMCNWYAHTYTLTVQTVTDNMCEQE